MASICNDGQGVLACKAGLGERLSASQSGPKPILPTAPHPDPCKRAGVVAVPCRAMSFARSITCRTMAWARASSARKTVLPFSSSSRRASCSLWLRITVSIMGLSSLAVAIIWRTLRVSGVAMTSMAARAMWAWISTAGSTASPNTAAMPLARRASTSSRFCSATTKGTSLAARAAARRRPTLP